MQNQKHLPLFGVGPMIAATMVTLAIIGIVVDRLGYINSGRTEHYVLAWIVGAILIVEGIALFYYTFKKSDVVESIKQNRLMTTGAYSLVRNPLYSGYLFISSGAVLLTTNMWLLIVPVVNWAFMTIVLKQTEEKWLVNLYGQPYVNYCKRVNRCIPWL